MLRSKLLDLLVLLQVGLGFVLDIVVKGHDDLLVVVDFGGADCHELRCHRPRIIMGHACLRLQRHIVASLDLLPRRQADGVPLDNLLGQRLRLRGRGRVEVREQGWGAGALQLCSEGILAVNRGRAVGFGTESEGSGPQSRRERAGKAELATASVGSQC